MGQRGIGAKPVKRSAPANKSKKPKAEAWAAPGLTRAQRVVAFIESLSITSGIFAGQPFKLRPWQLEIIEAIYATDEDGRRIKRQVLLTIPRKNGKTTGGAARLEPLFVVISTQSHDKNHVMSELVQYGKRVLSGAIEDATFLPVI